MVLVSNEIILSIQQLDKYFGKRHVIDHLSFDVRAGEIFGFLGPNGAGKTTTIKLVMGFLREDGGQIFINGIDKKDNYEDAMSYLGGIVENPEMYGNFTGRQNLQMYARTHGGISKERIDEIINLVGLDKRIDEKVKRYSLGMKQRVGLAQALVHRPKMLILDEPTNGLDPVGIHSLRDILRRLAHEEGIAILVSSHILSEMQLMCDRVGIINNGRLIDIKDVHDLGGQKDENGFLPFIFKLGYTRIPQSDPDLITAPETSDLPEVKADVPSLDNSPELIEQAKLALPEDLRDRVRNQDLSGFTLMATEAEVQKALIAIVSAGIPLIGLKREETSLEDLYMSVTGGGLEIA